MSENTIYFNLPNKWFLITQLNPNSETNEEGKSTTADMHKSKHNQYCIELAFTQQYTLIGSISTCRGQALWMRQINKYHEYDFNQK